MCFPTATRNGEKAVLLEIERKTSAVKDLRVVGRVRIVNVHNHAFTSNRFKRFCKVTLPRHGPQIVANRESNRLNNLIRLSVFDPFELGAFVGCECFSTIRFNTHSHDPSAFQDLIWGGSQASIFRRYDGIGIGQAAFGGDQHRELTALPQG